MMPTLGTKKLGTTKYIPSGMLTESVIGRTYELRIGTNGVPDPKVALEALKSGLEENFKTKVIYGEVHNSVILIQMTGSPFVWGAILMLLPQILAAVGIIVSLITVYMVVAAVPTWAYVLGAVGVTLLFVVPKVLPSVISGEVKLKGEEAG